MKVLWLTNFALPNISKEIGEEQRVHEGWLVGLSKELLKSDEIELILVFPQSLKKNITSGCIEGYQYYGYPMFHNRLEFNAELEMHFVRILSQVEPDVIHLMGSEFPHCYSMVMACKHIGVLDKAVISIQGLVSIYAKHYEAGLPEKYLRKATLRDLIKRDTLLGGKKLLEKRGKYELLALKEIRNVIGRTDWDKACTSQINPSVNYYFNNETLRPAFYEKKWNIEQCEKFSIFVSQGGKTIKGLHHVLEALNIIVKQYPLTKLYIAGSQIYQMKQYIPKWKRTAYENYIFQLIEKNNLRNNVVFCGTLHEKEMRDQYLKANVFVSASSIENSPNSVGEAMILGVPVVTSDVGGVKNLLQHGREGFIYQSDAPYMLAYYVCELFGNKELAMNISKNEIAHASVTHSKSKNLSELIGIYRSI